MRDEEPTPRESMSWSIWKIAVEELLEKLMDYALGRTRRGDTIRAAEAARLASEAAHLLELLDAEQGRGWTDETRVLRQQQILSLQARTETLMVGVVAPFTE